jgi:hypothetical protein
MAGTFSKSALPKRPGAYFNFQVVQAEPLLVNTVGAIALGITHSWGPENTVVQLNSFADFLALFGQGGTTPPAYTGGYKAVRDAFKGEGLPGYGGAGTVYAYRIVDSTGAKATKALSNGTTNALTLTALYKGTFGNQLSFTVTANPDNPSTNADLTIYVQGTIAEVFTYAKTDITDLAAQINGTTPYNADTKSDWVTAGSVTSGTALTVVSSPSAATSGNDGTGSIAAGDYSAARTAFEPYRFSVLAFENLTDSSILAAVKTWAVNLNAKGKRFLTVVGGGVAGAAETMSTAVTRSGTLNDPNFVNLGGGRFTDSDYGLVTTAQLAPRLAGIIAARGERSEITFARLTDLSIETGNAEADILAAIDGGVVAIARDSHPVAPLRFELGVTTYTTKSNTAIPYGIYSNIKFIRVMQSLEVELTEWAEQNVIGKMQVNQATRDFIRGQMEARMAARERDGVILPGWSVSTDTTPPPQPTDNFVALLYAVTLGRGLQKILNTVVVG